jgi:glycosyltransferase involved in cell wall biosynthesis
VEEVENLMKNYRVQLAPLRFGAGLKGKLLDAMRFGLPSVTTEVGAEGMCGNLKFGGSVTTSKEDFINASVKLYSEEKLWNQAQQNSFEVIKQRFQKSLFSEDFKKHIRILSLKLEKHRQENFIGQILQHHSLQSTKYLSKWIEAKNLN